MKKIFALMMLTLLNAVALAQQGILVEDDVQTAESGTQERQVNLYAQELQKLLIPDHAEFGVVKRPSFDMENSLIYDSLRRELVFITCIGKRNVWYSMYPAFHKKEKIDGKSCKEAWREKIGRYHLPRTKQYRLAVSEDFAQSLRALWKIAISQAKARSTNGFVTTDDLVVVQMDGTTLNYFIGEKYDKYKTPDFDGVEVDHLNRLVHRLQAIVKDGDVAELEGWKGEVDALYLQFLGMSGWWYLQNESSSSY